MEKLTIKERIMNIKPMNVGRNFRSPRTLLILYQVFAFLLAIYTKEEVSSKDFTLFIAAIFVILAVNLILPRITKGDPYLFLTVSMMFSIGVVMIYRLNPISGANQIIWFFIGIGIIFFVFFAMKIFPFWHELTVFYFVIMMIFFIITLIFGFGEGATNWVSFFGRTIQLSELNKVIFVFYLASFHLNKGFLGKYEKYRPFILMGSVYLFIAMFFLQKELGTALIFFGSYLLYLFVSGSDKKFIILNLLLSTFGAILAYLLFNHIRIRFTIWIDPWSHINDKGYQITQALFAISSGGFFGTGIGLGMPELIPVVTSDFIFAAICEEMGVFTGMGLIMLFLILVYRGFKITLEQQDVFYKYLAFGISMMFAIQAIVIFGGVLKLIPLTGITIPFVSYGGSSMVSSCIALGVLQFCSSEYSRKAEQDGKNK
ncbi:MAG: FtsW/RodA/SpoVE family cell cycle protein [Tissierellia bacterium]|nr:FtsW/RodA/SpoVE family cell cycle protein [Tissierellia bacterium]